MREPERLGEKAARSPYSTTRLRELWVEVCTICVRDEPPPPPYLLLLLLLEP